LMHFLAFCLLYFLFFWHTSHFDRRLIRFSLTSLSPLTFFPRVFSVSTLPPFFLLFFFFFSGLLFGFFGKFLFLVVSEPWGFRLHFTFPLNFPRATGWLFQAAVSSFLPHLVVWRCPLWCPLPTFFVVCSHPDFRNFSILSGFFPVLDSLASFLTLFLICRPFFLWISLLIFLDRLFCPGSSACHRVFVSSDARHDPQDPIAFPSVPPFFLSLKLDGAPPPPPPEQCLKYLF